MAASLGEAVCTHPQACRGDCFKLETNFGKTEDS